MKMTHIHEKMTGIFSGEKIIDNNILNLFGLQVFRILLTRFLHNLRATILFSDLSEEQKILRKDGIVFIKNFLPNDKFEALKNEFNNAKNLGGIYSEVKDEDSLITRHKFSSKIIDANLPITKDFLSNQHLLDLVYAGEARKVTPNAAWFDEISHSENKTGKPKPANAEKLHYDLFYHSIKVFYFMSDVSEKSAPFNFSPGTHHLSLKRLWIEYKKSITYKKLKYSFLQINDNEKSFLGLENNNIKAIVPANTLVIFDGLAFHRRGDFSVGKKRSQIYLSFRYNPFSLKTQITKFTKNKKVK